MNVSENKKIILIAGNKGSGKNTFSNVLRGLLPDCGFKIYSSRETSDTTHKFIKSSALYLETSFAGVLKDKVASILNVSLQELDSLKDTPLSVELLDNLEKTYKWFGEKPSSTPTARDVLIDEALRVRTMDPTFYVRTVYENLLQNFPEGKCVLVTDWRYKNELEFLKQFEDSLDIVTVKIESKAAPPVFVPSERDLDDLSFDFICHRASDLSPPPIDYHYICDI